MSANQDEKRQDLPSKERARSALDELAASLNAFVSGIHSDPISITSQPPRIVQIAASKHGLYGLDDSGAVWLFDRTQERIMPEDMGHEWHRLPSLHETKEQP